MPHLLELRVNRLVDADYLPIAPSYLDRVPKVVLDVDLQRSTLGRFWEIMYGLGWKVNPNMQLPDRAFELTVLALHSYAFEGVHGLTIFPSRAIAVTPTAESMEELLFPPVRDSEKWTYALANGFGRLSQLTLYDAVLSEGPAFPRGQLYSLSTLTILRGAPGERSLFDPTVLSQCGVLNATALRARPSVVRLAPSRVPAAARAHSGRRVLPGRPGRRDRAGRAAQLRARGTVRRARVVGSFERARGLGCV